MKSNRMSIYCGLAMAALLVGGPGRCLAQTADLTLSSFDTDPGGNLGHEWGSGTQAWDSSNGNPPGAALITVDFSNSSDTPCTTYFCLNGNPWYVGTAINFSQYKAIEFDIKWDNTSDITPAEFNDVSTIPITATNSAGQKILNGLLNAGSIGGLEVDLCGGPVGGQMGPTIVTTNIPAAAASGWVHMVLPINLTLAGLDGCTGIVFHKWVNQYSGQIANDFQGRFWIDNIVLQGTAGPPPPPTVSAPAKATPGLTVFASTAGLYDRQSAVLRQTSGLSWVGQATAANPVTYSFTVAGYPNSVNCEAWLFLVPNPNYEDNAPDWNETNCALFYLQGSTTSATGRFRYKVNENNQQAMYGSGNETRTTATTTNNYYYTAAPGTLGGGAITNVLSPGVYNITNESGDLAALASSTILGTWTLKFTSDTNVAVIAPDGSSTNFVIPAYNIGYFAEQGTPAFRIYLGMQANNVDAANQAVVYSNFAITGTAQPFSDNFLADSVLDTTNVWDTSASSGPKGVVLVPTGSDFWLSWTLPDNGFGLEVSSNLDNPLSWTTPALTTIVPLNGRRSEIVGSSDVPSGNTAFFKLIKRVATQLQVLLPGETNAPNTPTGKSGTPTPLSFAASSGAIQVTINSVDSTWHIVNTSDQVTLTSSDSGALTPVQTALQNGTLTEEVDFSAQGSFTVTATDATSTNILSNTSSAVTVGP